MGQLKYLYKVLTKLTLVSGFQLAQLVKSLMVE